MPVDYVVLKFNVKDFIFGKLVVVKKFLIFFLNFKALDIFIFF